MIGNSTISAIWKVRLLLRLPLCGVRIAIVFAHVETTATSVQAGDLGLILMAGAIREKGERENDLAVYISADDYFRSTELAMAHLYRYCFGQSAWMC